MELNATYEEMQRLQRCMSDLVSVLALPAVWSGQEPRQILTTFHDALMAMLDLDLLYARVGLDAGDKPTEVLTIAPRQGVAAGANEIRRVIRQQFGDDPQKWPAEMRSEVGGRIVSFLPLRLGLDGEIGVVVAASDRADFPTQTERLLLSVAANQATVGLQQARRLNEQQRTAGELEQRVAERTQQLAETNDELRRQIDKRKLVEKSLRDEKRELRRSQARSKAILDSALDCVVAIDHEARITEFNPAAERTFGYRRDDVIGRLLAEVLVPPSLRERHQQGFARYLATGETQILGRHLEMMALCADGSEIPVELAITRIQLPGPPSFTAYLRDITMRRRNEHALHEAMVQVVRSEKRWRSVFENSAVGVALTDLSGQFLTANPVFQQMLGYSDEELHALSFFDVTLKEHVELNRMLVNELIAGTRQEFQIEKQYRRKDGSLMWTRNHVSLVPGIERLDRFLMAIVDDISDAKRAEKALQENERNLISIINTIPTTAWSTRPDGYCEFLNRRWLEYAGMTAEQAEGWGWGAVIHPEDRGALAEYWQSCLTSGTPIQTEARMRRFDGIYRWFLFRANPLRDEDGMIVKWYGVNIDIEDRKQAEQALRGSEAFLIEGQRLSRTGTFSWNVLTNEVSWSEELYRICEIDLEIPATLELLRTRVHPDDLAMFNEIAARGIDNGTDFEHEHRLLMPDRSVKYLHVTAHATRDSEGRLVYIGAAQDITQRRLAELAAASSRSELASVLRAASLGALTASIAHEVNQPLAGIITNASTCLRMLDGNPPNIDGARETSRRTIRDGNRASDVVTRLRALFKKKEVATETLDLNDAAREVIALSLSDLQRNRVLLRYEFAENLPQVNADRVQIQQVILNLLRNASDAMSGVDGRPRQLLIKTESEMAGSVCLTVRDTGIGFAPEAADRLFESFYTTKEDGMGIGLSVSRSIIEAHRGRLWATGNDGPGSTFAFSIPCINRPIPSVRQ
jgi:PAS domain S-box-containing protein